MTGETQRRLARNEDTFREVNEGIARGRWPGEPQAPIGFRCECARLGCNKLLTLTLPEYESVRADPLRFIVIPGHELPAVEEIVARHPTYVVVKKTGAGGDEARARDPRA